MNMIYSRGSTYNDIIRKKNPNDFHQLGFLMCFTQTKYYAFSTGAKTSLSRATNFSLIRADLPERSRR